MTQRPQSDSQVPFSLQEELTKLQQLLQERPVGCVEDPKQSENLSAAKEKRRKEKDEKFQDLRVQLGKILSEPWAAQENSGRSTASSSDDSEAVLLQLIKEDHRNRLNEVVTVIQDCTAFKEALQKTLLAEVVNRQAERVADGQGRTRRVPERNSRR